MQMEKSKLYKNAIIRLVCGNDDTDIYNDEEDFDTLVLLCEEYSKAKESEENKK